MYLVNQLSQKDMVKDCEVKHQKTHIRYIVLTIALLWAEVKNVSSSSMPINL